MGGAPKNIRSPPPKRLVIARPEKDAVGVFGAAKVGTPHLAARGDDGPQLDQGGGILAGLHPARELFVFRSGAHLRITQAALVEEERPAADGANHGHLRR